MILGCSYNYYANNHHANNMYQQITPREMCVKDTPYLQSTNNHIIIHLCLYPHWQITITHTHTHTHTYTHTHTPLCLSEGPGEITREVVLDLQVSPEEIMSREVDLGCESWTLFASSCCSTSMQRTLSWWLCPAQQLKQQFGSTLVAAQWRGDTALTLLLFRRRSTASSVFRVGARDRAFPLSPLPPPPRPSP